MRPSPDLKPSAGSGRAATRLHAASPVLLAGAVLLAMLAGTCSLWREAEAEARRDLRAYFDYRVRDAAARIQGRMAAHEQVLRGAAGLFAASDEVTRDDFDAYVSALQLEQSYPGIQGVGFARAAEGRPGSTTAVVAYVAPPDDRNARSVGYDMFSEPVRREALERARDTGTAALSGKVRLRQEAEPDVQPGVLLVLPVYRNGAPRETLQERRDGLAGWVYCAFRMRDLMGGIIGERSSDLDVEIFDGGVPTLATLLHDDDGVPLEAAPPGEELRTARSLWIGGREWTLSARSLPGLARRVATDRPRLIVVSGAGAGVVLALLVWLLASGRARALRETRQLTRDLVERREAEEALRRKEAFYASVLRASPDFWSVLDDDGRARYVSSGASAVVGWSAEELLRQEPFALVHPDDRERVVATFQALRGRPGGTARASYRFRHKDGTWHVLDTAARNLLEDADVRGVVVNRRDVTEQQRLEEQFRQSQKLEAVGRLAGGLAHDFNNVLQIVLAGIDTLRAQVPREDPRREEVEQIADAAWRSVGLTRQLLAFSRNQVLQPVVFDLNDSVEGMEKMLRRLIGEDIELVTRRAPALGRIRADPGQVEQVIVNLAVNARDAMATGGRLTLETANVDVGGVARPAHLGIPAGSYVMLAVADTGHGMTAEVQSHLFEPFFTTKERGKGTGLGLSTVYGIVKQAGGEIRVDSEVGRGTVVRVLFPRCEAAAETVAAPRDDAAPERGDETLLLVEDDAQVRGTLSRVLRGAGYTVFEASDGNDALGVARARAHPFDAVLTDVVMPGLGGAELVARLRAEQPGVKVLFASGYADQGAALCGSLGAGSAYLQKPFTPSALRHAVRELLDRPA